MKNSIVSDPTAAPMLAPGNDEADFKALMEELEASEMAEQPAEPSPPKELSDLLVAKQDPVVAQINEIATKTVESGMEQIGEYLLKVVFDFDLVAASSRNPRKKESFAAICNHPDLLVDPRRLGESLKAAALSHLLKDQGLELRNLTFTHKLYLSRIQDEQQRIALAVEVNEKQYSVSKLRELIARSLPQGTGGLGKALARVISKPNETRNNPDFMAVLQDSRLLTRRLTKADRIDLRVKSAKAREELLEYCTFLKQVEESLFEIELSERGLHLEAAENESEDEG